MTARAYVSADDLLAPPPGADGEDVELPGGKWVRIRALTRQDVIDAQAAGRVDEDTWDEAAWSRVIISRGLVEPAMTVEQVAAWCAVPGRAVDVVRAQDAILRLGAVGQDAEREAAKSLDGQPEPSQRPDASPPVRGNARRHPSAT